MASSELSHVAALLSDDANVRYLVTTYQAHGKGPLDEVETTPFPSEAIALAEAEKAARHYPVAIASREVENALGVCRTAVLKVFGTEPV